MVVKNGDLRNLLLNYYYTYREEAPFLPNQYDLGFLITDDEIIRILNQLNELGLIDWFQITRFGSADLKAKITALGIDVIEKRVAPPKQKRRKKIK